MLTGTGNQVAAPATLSIFDPATKHWYALTYLFRNESFHSHYLRSRTGGTYLVNLAKTNGHGSRRRTKRISLQIPLMVTGRDEHGTVFADQVLTENVSKDGGCLIFSRDLRRMQVVQN